MSLNQIWRKRLAAGTGFYINYNITALIDEVLLSVFICYLSDIFPYPFFVTGRMRNITYVYKMLYNSLRFKSMLCLQKVKRMCGREAAAALA